MIPLRSSCSVQKIHPLVFIILVGWLAAQIIVWQKGPLFLESLSVIPFHFQIKSVITSLFVHESWFSMLFSMLYFWVFGPAIFEMFKPWPLFISSLAGSIGALWLFCAIHHNASAPVLSSDAFLGFYLGAFMRKDIWGTVDTLVIGPFWIRVFSVPSYVLLFFWFFYLLIANLIMSPPFSDAPMLYLIPLLGFLAGFLYGSFKKTLHHLYTEAPPE